MRPLRMLHVESHRARNGHHINRIRNLRNTDDYPLRDALTSSPAFMRGRMSTPPNATRWPCGSAARPDAGRARTSTCAANRPWRSAVGRATTGTTIASSCPRRACTDPRASYMPAMPVVALPIPFGGESEVGQVGGPFQCVHRSSPFMLSSRIRWISSPV